MQMLEHINIDLALIGVSGCSADAGFTCGTESDMVVKQMVIHKARTSVLMCGKEKLSALMPYTFAKLDDIDFLISDAQLPDSFVQAAHIDINSVTETLTDIESAFDTSFMVNKAQHYLMTKLIKKGALLFFIGGDNFMSPCNGLSEQEIEDIMVEIDEEIGIKLKAGIGRGKNAEDAAYMADIGLEEIRANNNEMWTWVIEKEY